MIPAVQLCSLISCSTSLPTLGNLLFKCSTVVSAVIRSASNDSNLVCKILKSLFAASTVLLTTSNMAVRLVASNCGKVPENSGVLVFSYADCNESTAAEANFNFFLYPAKSIFSGSLTNLALFDAISLALPLNEFSALFNSGFSTLVKIESLYKLIKNFDNEKIKI